MVDRQIRDHSLEIALGPGRQWRQDDRADDQPQNPRPGDFYFIGEEWNEQTNEAIHAHLGKRAGENHRNAGRRGLVRVRQPGVKWKYRNLDRKTEKNSGEDKPTSIAADQAGPPEIGQFREIERSFGKINPEERHQHENAAE